MKGEECYPCRLRRLSRVFVSMPIYFLTFCAEQREKVLDNEDVFARVKLFSAESLSRYGVWINAYILMPDHVHIIIRLSQNSVSVGVWVKAFKAFVGKRKFCWQQGFFDHVLRSEESLSEKWEYLQLNPVRAGLVDNIEEWLYREAFNAFDGSCL